MIKKLNALGDRMLGVMLPKATASADICRGRFLGGGSCLYWCYTYSNGSRSTKYRSCDGGPCTIVCSDCCY